MNDAVRGSPVGRLAPSPTGQLHLGHARTFLIAWWHTRSRGGRVLLRIDDLDRERLRPGMTDLVLEDLEWLGLTWDGPIEWQSKHNERYLAAAEQLSDSDKAFACVCSRSDLERVQSAPHAEDRELHYPGTCRGRFSSWEEARAYGHGNSHGAAIRFKVPAGAISIRDAFSGQHQFDVSQEVGDFVIVRRDGAASYQLATAVDDAAEGVTEVVRGDDLLASAARQGLLQASLGLPVPTWVHVPLVVDEGGQRLAKRKSSLSLQALRQAGVDPRALIQWAAGSSGLDLGEWGTAAEVTAEFRLDRVPREVVRAPKFFETEG